MSRSTLPLGVCVVGCGQISRSHLRAVAALSDSARLVSVVDVDEGRARATAAEYNVPHWTTRPEEAFRRSDVDAAILCLPHHLHAPLTIAAAQAGVHVLCEKPMALNSDEAGQMLDAAEKAGVCLMIGHSRRFSPAAMKARELVGAGALGALRHVSSYFLTYIEAPSTEWRKSNAESGGYMIPIFGTHLIDLLTWVSHSEVRRVYCQAGAFWGKSEGEDEAAIVLTLQQGEGGRQVPCTVVMSGNCTLPKEPGPRTRDELVVAGEKGTIVLGRGRLFLNGEPVSPAGGAKGETGSDSFLLQTQEFLAAIAAGREPISSGREAFAVMQVLDACHTSAREHIAVDLGA